MNLCGLIVLHETWNIENYKMEELLKEVNVEAWIITIAVTSHCIQDRKESNS